MVIKHATTKTPGQRVFAVIDWNANHTGTAEPDAHAIDGVKHTGDITDAQHGVRTLANAHSHADLSNVTSDQHHAQAHTLASHSTKAHTELTGVTANQHHTPTPPVPTGTILMYGTAAAPTGYLLCAGAAISRITYAALYAIIGTTYGVGDGSTTFNVPNFASKFPRGNTAGATGGSDNAINVTHTHTNSVGNQSVSHTHTHDHGSFNSGTVSAWHTHSVTGGGHRHGLSYGVSGSGYNCLHDFSETRIAYTTAWTRVDGTHTHTVGNPSANHYHAVDVPSKTSGNQSASHNHTTTIDNAGANGTNANIPAYLGVNFIIKY